MITRMSCFTIELVLPKQRREICQRAAQSRVEHIIKNCNGILKSLDKSNESIVYEIVVCNEDAAILLRDFPMPFYVQKITILSTGYPLYVFRKHSLPPPSLLYKHVYWLAKSTERYAKPNVLL